MKKLLEHILTFNFCTHHWEVCNSTPSQAEIDITRRMIKEWEQEAQDLLLECAELNRILDNI